MNRARIIQAAISAVIAMDIEVSTRSVQDMCGRICGKRLQTGDVLAGLREWRSTVTPQSQASNATVTHLEHKNDYSSNDSVIVQKPLTHATADHGGVVIVSAEPHTESPPPPKPSTPAESETAARHLVAVPDSPETPGLLPGFVAPAPKPRQVRIDTRSAAEQVADIAVAALRSTIEPRLVGIRWTDWCKRGNRRTAISMAASGLTADAIVAAHAAASDDRGETVLWLSAVQNWVMRNGGADSGPGEALAGRNGTRRYDRPEPAENASDALPSAADLIAEDIANGTYVPVVIQPWERPPDHPLWAPRPKVARA